MRSTPLLVLCCLLAGPSSGEEGPEPPYWARFRGPNGSGVAENDSPPVEFGPSRNVLWKTPVPPGHSSPIVWGDHLFLTAIDGEALMVIAVRRSDGAILWRREIATDTIEKVHQFSSPAASTPVTDGRRVYAYFGSYGLVAMDFEGREAWRRPTQQLSTNYGTASSPIVLDGRLVLQRDGNRDESELLALDSETGDVVWRTARPTLGESYSTPGLWSHDGEGEIVTVGNNRVVAYSAADGKELWWAPGSTPQPIGVPVFGDGLVFASATYAGSTADPFPLPSWAELIARYDADESRTLTWGEVPEDVKVHFRKELPEDAPDASLSLAGFVWWLGDADKDETVTKQEWDAMLAHIEANEDRVVAIRPRDGSDGRQGRVIWQADHGLSEIPSPLLYRDRLYFVRDGGMVTSYEAQTGTLVLDRRRLGALGKYVASPVAAAGRIYAASFRGTVVVFRAGDALEILARNDLGEEISGTPAIAADTLYVRTAQHLWAFGD